MTDASGLFVWDGVRILASEGRLWYGDEALCNLTAGPKEFAVVNTKLVVWPDGVAVDLKARSVTHLAARAENRGVAEMTDHTLTLQPHSVYSTTNLTYRGSEGLRPWLWSCTDVSWSQEGGWTVEGGAWLRPDQSVGRYCLPAVSYSQATRRYIAAQPPVVYASKAPTEPPQPGNEEGFYVRITGFEGLDMTADSYRVQLAAELYWARQEGQSLAELFRPGQAVSITGTAWGVRDVDKRIIRAIDPATNTLTFDPGTFRAGDAVGVTDKDRTGIVYLSWTDADTVYRRKATDVEARAGWYLVADEGDKVLRVYDGDWALQGEYPTQSATTVAGLDPVSLEPMGATGRPVAVQRPIPALDHICHHDNRLWGVCSADNTIYASALGDPCCFYTYDGLSTDSYAVAVGSQGPFTALCSYAGGVLCWKEDGLHKVLGTLPDNYQLMTCTLAGVARDSGESLVAVNDRLYYLGRDGVYAFAGGLPTLISAGLGDEPLTGGVGGTDGKCYYLSVKRGQETELLCYDIRLGLWTRRGPGGVLAFARGEEGLLCLRESCLSTLEAGQGVGAWLGELAPLYESLDRVQYRALRLRAHLEPGSCLKVEARYDGGAWQRLGWLHAGGHRVAQLTMPVRRCGVLQLRLSGRGDCTVLELERQYRRRGRG